MDDVPNKSKLKKKTILIALGSLGVLAIGVAAIVIILLVKTNTVAITSGGSSSGGGGGNGLAHGPSNLNGATILMISENGTSSLNTVSRLGNTLHIVAPPQVPTNKWVLTKIVDISSTAAQYTIVNPTSSGTPAAALSYTTISFLDVPNTADTFGQNWVINKTLGTSRFGNGAVYTIYRAGSPNNYLGYTPNPSTSELVNVNTVAAGNSQLFSFVFLA